MLCTSLPRYSYWLWYADGREALIAADTHTMNMMQHNGERRTSSDEDEEEEQQLEHTADVIANTQIDEYHMPKKLMVTDPSGMTTNLSATQLANEVSLSECDVSTNLPSVDIAGGGGGAVGESRVLVLYTGGTIGMRTRDGVYQPEAYYLPRAIRDLPPLNDKPYVNEHYAQSKIVPYCLPPIRHMQKRIVYWVVEYDPLLDSSDMTFDDWIRIAKDIQKSYAKYDGFVVLHGTDTLSYTACALSFMLENLGKPVVITGAQIPVAEVRSDGRENLIGALIVAGNLDIPEVTVYFNNKLLRGNRTIKLDNSALEAFDSPNMAAIATMEIKINVNYESIYRSPFVAPFSVHSQLCRNVGLIRIFPSIAIESIKAFLQMPMQGVVLQTFGAGNMPSRRTDIIAELKAAVDRGCIIVNCTQCVRGHVDVHYFTGKILYDIGVIPGADMTPEAALTKLAYVIGKDEWDLARKRKMMQQNIRGELTVARSDTLQELEIIPRLAKFLRISSSQEVQLLRNALFPPLICHAASIGDIELLESLRESGANFSSPDYNRRTALHVACSSGNVTTVEYLLTHGASVHARDQWDENPLMSAVRSKNIECIRAVRGAGGLIVSSRTALGMELCLAASRCNMDVIAAWKEAGVDLNTADYDGRTALHIAARNGSTDLVQYLLDSGANANAIDNFGRTASRESDEKGHTHIANMIKKQQQPSSLIAAS